ncbi:MAG: T9SS type A sorting domain-containing protein [Bacteroidales bacterium]|nr:T9SS type A sorting domain-containing protein [Bacteroidales bacterium]
MKKILATTLFFLVIYIVTGHSQTVPNGGFENWETRVLYEEPAEWTTGNMLSFLFNVTVASKTTDSYCGDYALRLDTRVTDETIPGFAFSNGMITTGNMDEGFQFSGGIPVSGSPTGLSGFFKYNIPFLDVGLILVAFKKDGNSVGQVIYPLLFSSSTYTKIDIPVSDLSDVPDSAFIAFATTNPDDPRTGGWIQVDSLWFTGIEDTVPNGNFESWQEAAYFEPTSWLTGNLFSHLFGGDTSATRTEDAYAGNYAIRIESVETLVPDDDGIIYANMGYIMPYSESVNLNESMPAFPVDINPSGLTGYYKFQPFENDTALIMAILTDSKGNEYTAVRPLPASADYTEFKLDFSYPLNVLITQVSIIANTSLYFDPSTQIQNLGESGSVLFLDELNLADACNYSETFTIETLQENVCGNDTAILSAGEGWGSITWSTGDTTEEITVVVDEPMEVSALVTSATSWCFYTDTIRLAPLDGCVNLNTTHNSDDLRIYPNPGNGLINIDLEDKYTGEILLEVYNETGQLVFRKTLSPKGGYVAIDLSELKKGLYYIKITSLVKTFNKTLLIE